MIQGQELSSGEVFVGCFAGPVRVLEELNVAGLERLWHALGARGQTAAEDVTAPGSLLSAGVFPLGFAREN